MGDELSVKGNNEKFKGESRHKLHQRELFAVTYFCPRLSEIIEQPVYSANDCPLLDFKDWNTLAI